MKSNKTIMREQLQVEMAMFLNQGGEIKKHKLVKKPDMRQYQPKEKTVEIEVDFLPEALRIKHFGE